MPAEDITLYAKWNINQYTIDFNSNGGSDVTSITQDYDTDVIAPTAPTKTGYTFAGWYSDRNLIYPFTFSTIPPKNITLYAKWNITVNFDSNGGSSVNSYDITQSFIKHALSDNSFSMTYNIQTADLNNDGYNDIITSNLLGNTIRWFDNDGGIFTEHTISLTGPATIKVSDINHDGYLDIIVNYKIDDSHIGISWLKNNHDNTFTNINIASISSNVSDPRNLMLINMDVIDINNDGYDDVIILGKEQIMRYLNNGNETFTQMSEISSDNINAIYSIDYNHDGRIDIVFATSTDIKWMENNGDGTFAQAVSLISESEISNIFVADLDNDDYLDIVCSSDSDLYVYLNKGDNTFTQSLIISSFAFQFYLSDLNNDNYLELLIANPQDAYIKIYQNNKDGSFSLQETFSDSNMPMSIYASDLNNDGYKDILYGVYSGNNYWMDNINKLVAPTPTKIDHTFNGWYLDSSLNISYDFTQPIRSNLTLYADYHPNEVTVSFNSNGGSTITQENVDYSTTVTEPDIPTKTGYTFVGWYTDVDLTTVFNFETLITTDMTLYAKWEINEYTVTFKDYDGTVIETQTIDYGNSATAPNDPTRAGYTFSDWDKTFDNITGDLIITAEYTINSYTVTFKDYDGTVIETQTIDYGNSATAPNDPTRAGYTFSDWDKTFDNITGDLIITAEYTINSYTVTFKDYDGTVIETQTIDYGNSATAPNDPTRTGYTFSGWDTTFEDITSDTIVTATYMHNSNIGKVLLVSGIIGVILVGGGLVFRYRKN